MQTQDVRVRDESVPFFDWQTGSNDPEINYVPRYRISATHPKTSLHVNGLVSDSIENLSGPIKFPERTEIIARTANFQIISRGTYAI